jgi:hypothetical protein
VFRGWRKTGGHTPLRGHHKHVAELTNRRILQIAECKTLGYGTPIIRPRAMGQLTGSLRAFKIKPGGAERKKLEEIWMNIGETPEMLAW